MLRRIISIQGVETVCQSVERCANKMKIVVSINTFHELEELSERALLDAVGTVGPVSVAIASHQPIFRNYQSGIINDPSCATDADHEVLVVGYGTENGQDYWIIKNR